MPTQHIEITHPNIVNLKLAFHKGGVLSPTLFNIYTSDLPPPSAPVQVMACADITMTSTHTSTSAAKKYI